MKSLESFYKITDAESYFKFFDLEYSLWLINVKRFHIMRKFGEMIAKAKEAPGLTEEKLLDFYKFALVSVYKSFESGYNPSAAEIWSMFDRPNPCLECATMGDCNTKEMFDAGESNNCRNRDDLSFDER